MNSALAAELQTLLEGVRLPATRDELLAYARSQTDEERLIAPLRRLPDREYGFLDDVGEELVHVQPAAEEQRPAEPRPESGDVPGGDAYTRHG